MKLKPFDLEKAKAGHKVCTRDGRPARIICWDLKSRYPIVAAIEKAPNEVLETYTNEGYIYHLPDKHGNASDLMLAVNTVKQEGWVNLFRYDSRVGVGGVYETKEKALAERYYDSTYITTVKIVWEDEL